MNRRNKKLTKNFKDYLVPLAWVLIIIIIILNVIFWWDDNTNENITWNNPLLLSLDSEWTNAFIVFSSWDKKEITGEEKLNKWEKLQVWTSWSVKIEVENGSWALWLNKLWELKYNSEWNYTLLSSDLWVNSKDNLNIEMRYMKVLNTTEAVFNLSQNEVASSIYVLAWNVEVQNLAWSKTNIQKWQKISLMRADANDENLDISIKKEEIDDYIKSEDWYIKNNWDFYLNKSDDIIENNISWSWVISNSWNTNNSWYWYNYVSFNVADESDISKDTLDLEWSILDSIVSKIEINWQTADVNNENKTFSLKWLKLSSRVNNIVYRIFDDSNKLIDKWVLTLYYSAWTTSTVNNTAWLAAVENYSLKSPASYKIISPTKNPYTTTENLVKIEWTVPWSTVKKIVINDFELQKFPQYWTYWSYFANSDFGNLKEWLNIYKIQYFGSDDKVLNESIFTIVKEKAVETTTTENTDTQDNTLTWEVTE